MPLLLYTDVTSLEPYPSFRRKRRAWLVAIEIASLTG